jgi:hypothetical protein
MNATPSAQRAPMVQPFRRPHATCPHNYAQSACVANYLPSARGASSRRSLAARAHATRDSMALRSPTYWASTAAAVAATPAIPASVLSPIVPIFRRAAAWQVTVPNAAARTAAAPVTALTVRLYPRAARSSEWPNSLAMRLPTPQAAARRRPARGRQMYRPPAASFPSPRGRSSAHDSSWHRERGWHAFAASGVGMFVSRGAPTCSRGCAAGACHPALLLLHIGISPSSPRQAGPTVAGWNCRV